MAAQLTVPVMQVKGSSSTAQRGLWALLDQGMASIAHLTAGLLLARFCTPQEYGIYALAWACLHLLNNLQTVLITRPLLVLGPGREAEEFGAYATALGRGQLWGTALLALATTAVMWALQFFAVVSAGVAATFAAMALALFLLQGQDFCRAVLFARLRPDLAARCNLVYCSCYVALVVGLWSSGWLSSSNVFLCMAVAATAGLWIALRYTAPYRQAGPLEMKRHWRENWQFARWGMGTMAGESLLRQGNLLAAAAFSGAAGAAVMEAARLIVAPLQMVVIAGSRVIMPGAAEALNRRGPKAMMRFLLPTSVVWGAFFIGYPLVILMAPEFWLRLLYGAKYQGAGSVLAAWAVMFCVIGLSALPWHVVNVLRRPEVEFWATASAGVMGVLLSVWWSYSHGPWGAVLGRLAGEGALLVGGLWAMRRYLQQRHLKQPRSEG